MTMNLVNIFHLIDSKKKKYFFLMMRSLRKYITFFYIYYIAVNYTRLLCIPSPVMQ